MVETNKLVNLTVKKYIDFFVYGVTFIQMKSY